MQGFEWLQWMQYAQEIILIQGFYPLNIEITPFLDGFCILKPFFLKKI